MQAGINTGRLAVAASMMAMNCSQLWLAWDKIVIVVSCGVQAAVTLEWLEQQSEVVLTAPARPC